MPPHLEVREIEPLQVGEIDIGCDHMTGRADLLREPDCNRSATGAHVEAAPAGPDEAALPTRRRIEELFQEAQSLILSLLASRRRQTIARLGVSDSVTLHVPAVRSVCQGRERVA
jgi:hypothetical protein